MKKYFKKALFWLKSGAMLAAGSVFCFIKAVFPFAPIPRIWSMHTLSTKLAIEYFELYYEEKKVDNKDQE